MAGALPAITRRSHCGGMRGTKVNGIGRAAKEKREKQNRAGINPQLPQRLTGANQHLNDGGSAGHSGPKMRRQGEYAQDTNASTRFRHKIVELRTKTGPHQEVNEQYSPGSLSSAQIRWRSHVVQDKQHGHGKSVGRTIKRGQNFARFVQRTAPYKPLRRGRGKSRSTCAKATGSSPKTKIALISQELGANRQWPYYLTRQGRCLQVEK